MAGRLLLRFGGILLSTMKQKLEATKIISFRGGDDTKIKVIRKSLNRMDEEKLLSVFNLIPDDISEDSGFFTPDEFDDRDNEINRDEAMERLSGLQQKTIINRIKTLNNKGANIETTDQMSREELLETMFNKLGINETLVIFGREKLQKLGQEVSRQEIEQILVPTNPQTDEEIEERLLLNDNDIRIIDLHFNKSQAQIVREWKDKKNQEKSHLFLLAVLGTDLSSNTTINPSNKTLLNIDRDNPEFSRFLDTFNEEASEEDKEKMDAWLISLDNLTIPSGAPFNPTRRLSPQERIEKVLATRRGREERQAVRIAVGIREPVEREGIRVRTEEVNQLFSTT